MPELKLTSEITLSKPIIRESITKISLPDRQHFTVVVNGQPQCIWIELADTPETVRQWILSQAEGKVI
jgi:hypothetical protein